MNVVVILRVVFAVAAFYCLLALLGWAHAHDPQPTPRPPQQVRCHQPRPRPTLPADVDGECRNILERAGLEERQ